MKMIRGDNFLFHFLVRTPSFFSMWEKYIRNNKSIKQMDFQVIRKLKYFYISRNKAAYRVFVSPYEIYVAPHNYQMLCIQNRNRPPKHLRKVSLNHTLEGYFLWHLLFQFHYHQYLEFYLA